MPMFDLLEWAVNIVCIRNNRTSVNLTIWLSRINTFLKIMKKNKLL